MLDVAHESITFQTRSARELCGNDRKALLLSISFTDSAIWDFLESYYQGRISKSFLVGGQYDLTKCHRCGFMWQTQILNDQGMNKLYNELIPAEDSLRKKRLADLSLFSGYAREVETIPLLVGRRYPAEITVLDYGIGWGYWCLMAKAFGFNVMGLEPSVKRGNFAARNRIKVLGDLRELVEESIDFIYIEQIFATKVLGQRFVLDVGILTIANFIRTALSFVQGILLAGRLAPKLFCSIL